MLAIEIYGYSYQIVEVYKKDVIKEDIINSLGISLLRFTDNHVFNDMDNVLRAIEAFILEFEEVNGRDID